MSITITSEVVKRTVTIYGDLGPDQYYTKSVRVYHISISGEACYNKLMMGFQKHNSKLELQFQDDQERFLNAERVNAAKYHQALDEYNKLSKWKKFCSSAPIVEYASADQVKRSKSRLNAAIKELNTLSATDPKFFSVVRVVEDDPAHDLYYTLLTSKL
jgi:hypothetical protein